MGGKRTLRANDQSASDGKDPNGDGCLAYIYVGLGYVPGVPARNLTANDVVACEPGPWKEALATGLYEEVNDAGTQTTT
jgi:hypothetical protein